jgi:hypothetical protein
MELELPKWKYKIWNSTENCGIQKPTFQILVQCLPSKIWKLNFQKKWNSSESENVSHKKKIVKFCLPPGGKYNISTLPICDF